ncbi:unnamed protein product, partial [Mesorhabditis spiculigera]
MSEDEKPRVPRKFQAKRVHGKSSTADATIEWTGDTINCGHGRFSTVVLISLEQPEQGLFAYKHVKATQLCRPKGKGSSTEPLPQKEGELPAEIEILSKIQHNHCLRLLYYQLTTDIGNPYNMILDMLPHEVGRHLKDNRKGFNLLDTKVLSWQMFNALAYLASMNIAHLDIKPANLIFDENTMLLKLADFGNARIISNEADYMPYQVARPYRAPELMFDVWSGGCVMAEIATGQTLFTSAKTKEMAAVVVNVLGYPTDEDVKAMKVGRPRVRKGKNLGLQKHMPSIPKEMLPVLEKILVYNIKKRITAHRLLSDPFFAELKLLPKRSNGHRIPDFGYDIHEQATQFDEHTRTAESKSEYDPPARSEYHIMSTPIKDKSEAPRSEAPKNEGKTMRADLKPRSRCAHKPKTAREVNGNHTQPKTLPKTTSKCEHP